MPFVPALNTLRVFWEFTFQGKPGCGFVTHFTNTEGPWSVALMEELGSELVTIWDTLHQSTVGAGVTLNRLRMRDMTTAEGLVYDYTTGLPLTGTRSDPTLPANIAWCIKWDTGLSGRSRRGRTYHFGLTEDQVSGNEVAPTSASLIVAAYNALVTVEGATVDYKLVVASYVSEGQPRATALLTPVVQATFVDRRVDTQRRRLTAGGAG